MYNVLKQFAVKDVVAILFFKNYQGKGILISCYDFLRHTLQRTQKFTVADTAEGSLIALK